LVKSESRSRPLNHLFEVSRERSKAPLLIRSRPSRRPRALAQARTNPSSTHWPVHSWKKMGATESSDCCVDGIFDCCGSDHELGCLAKGINPSSNNKRGRRSAI